MRGVGRNVKGRLVPSRALSWLQLYFIQTATGHSNCLLRSEFLIIFGHLVSINIYSICRTVCFTERIISYRSIMTYNIHRPGTLVWYLYYVGKSSMLGKWIANAGLSEYLIVIVILIVNPIFIHRRLKMKLNKVHR